MLLTLTRLSVAIAAATLLLFNSNDVRPDDSNDAYLRLVLPRGCGGPIRRAAKISVSDS